MNNDVILLEDGDFEIKPEKPYEFTRDVLVEQKIKDDKRRKSEESLRSKGEDCEGLRERNSYVSGRNWGSGD